jgi:hypothetical protein
MLVIPMKIFFPHVCCLSGESFLMLNNYDIDCEKNIWLVHLHLKLDSIKTISICYN